MAAPTERQVAQLLFDRFQIFYDHFLDITRDARQRFEQAEWQAVHEAAAERIKLYDRHVRCLIRVLEPRMRSIEVTPVLLQGIKNHYTQLIKDDSNFEIAESFFNSVYRRIFHHDNISDDQLFTQTSQNATDWDYSDLCLEFKGTNLSELIGNTLTELPLSNPFEDINRDIVAVVDRLRKKFPGIDASQEQKLTMLKPIFYRNKGANLVGHYVSNHQSFPFVLPLLLTDERQLYIDTVLTSTENVSITFGFARSYFFVDAPSPRRIINFLKVLMPHKTDYELFTAIGCQKHAKTELYRHYLAHLNQSKDNFEVAPGIKGMVMSVFTLPSYDIVFKVIKDRFTPPKEVDHEMVKAKYELVKTHDRVGRMADTQEFTNFEFPRHRFSQALIDELQTVAPSLLHISEETITISHLYTERKMIPLNIYIQQANEQELVDILDEYGNAIKQLAAANIFPGDMLFKNFGVTRHGRVVFYDYDEISYMTECNFRKIPPPRYPEDELAAEPWYSVGPHDVFPEEFAVFLLIKPEIRKIFRQLHGDLFTAAYWQKMKDNIQSGHLEDVFPYRQHKRFIFHRE